MIPAQEIVSLIQQQTGEPQPTTASEQRGLGPLADALGGTLKNQTVHWQQDGLEASFSWAPGNNQSCQCHVSGSLPATVTFTKREFLDRWLAPFVASAELSRGDTPFDRDIRVVTRDIAAARMLTLKPARLKAIRALLDRGFSSVTFDEKGVTVKGPRKLVGHAQPSAEQVRPLVALLAQLRAMALAQGHFAQAPRYDMAVVLSWAAVTLTGILGGVGWLTSHVEAPLLNSTEMLKPVLGLSALALPFAWSLSTRFFGRMSSPERLVFGLCLGWMIAIPLGTLGLSLTINHAFDPSEPTARLETVINKYQWTDDENNPQARVVIASPWQSEPKARFGVSSRNYDSIVVGESRLAVPTHPGVLGWQWHDPMRILPAALPPAKPALPDTQGDG